jgi:RES domain-containing protein
MREYQQLSPLVPPGTLVSYTIQVEKVVDFRGGYIAGAWSPLWEEFYCDWRDLWFNKRIESPSWVLADEVIEAGACGLLFRSMVAPGGTNLVVFVDSMRSADKLEVYDPAGALPRNQDSWR